MPIEPRSLKELFLAALAVAPAERAAWLERDCGQDMELRRRVELMLAAHDTPQSLLDRLAPAAEPPEGATGAFKAEEAERLPREKPEEAGALIAGRYKLVEQIGEGGMGLVFVSEQQHPIRRKVALKVIKPGMDTRQVIARFEAERQALALMDHPNIARVLDGGQTGSGRPYFVMDLVKGLPITKYCDEHRLTPRQRLELFVPVCQAIQHAHQKGIIHRDVKPSNVLVARYDGKPVVKVIDFGIAKATGQQLTDKTLVTGFSGVVGTLEYMSPEQAELNNQDIDTRSDIYSLGVLLYELLTGTTPLTKERLKQAPFTEMLRIIRQEEPPKPSTRLSNSDTVTTIAAARQTEPGKLSGLVRGELDWVVMKCLEKDRSRRYQTASALAADVERYLRDEPVQAGPPSAWYHCRKFVRRHRGALLMTSVVMAGLVLAGAALGGSISWAMHDRADRLTKATAEIDQALGDAGSLYRDRKLPQATAAAEKARALLSTARGNKGLERRVREMLADLRLVAELEDVRLRASDRVTSQPNRWMSSFDDLKRSFRNHGLDLDALPAAEAAARIAARPVRTDLVLALDIWAMSSRFAPGASAPAGWQRLVEIAQAADDPDRLAQPAAPGGARG
jgi:serine/threonine protein kinase